MRLLNKVIVFLVALIGSLLVVALTETLAQFLGWTLFKAAIGNDVFAKQWILFGWTFASMILAFVIRMIVLVRSMYYHHLRFLAYFKHAGTSAVLAGGLAYGTVNLITAGLNAIMDDAETIDVSGDEVFLKLFWLAMAPIFITMMAATITAHNNITKIPHPN